MIQETAKSPAIADNPCYHWQPQPWEPVSCWPPTAAGRNAKPLQAASASQQAADLAAREASVAAQTVATVNVEGPYLEVSTLAALAGVVKETFTGVWEDAVRISAADAPITIVRHYGMDMDEYNRKLAGWIAYSEAKLKEKYLAEQEAIAAAEKENDTRRYQAETDRYSGLAAEYIANQERIKQEKLAQAAADERAEQAAKAKTHFAATVTTYQEQQAKQKAEALAAAALTALNNKMARDEIKITQNMSPMTKEEQDRWDKFVRDESKFGIPGESTLSDEEFYQIRDPLGYNDYGATNAFVTEQVILDPYEGPEIEPPPKWLGEFTLSMIPIVGDGSGIIKELYNLLLTGEMDELNFTLSVIGLAMDLPFDAGFVGDAGVATMKAFSSMIPVGPAREVLLDVVKQVGKNPEQIGALGTAVWKLLGKEDLMKVLVDNPNALKAVLEGGSEAVENLLKHEDELIKLGKAVDEDMLKVAMDSSETALKNADELGEAGGKALSENSDEITEIIAQKQAIADEAAQNYNNKYRISPAERANVKGYDGVGTTPNGGPTFQESDWMYPVEEGQLNVVKIEAQGNRPDDFLIAN